MIILTLNIWAGERREELEKYITEKSKFVDVFCLQEVRDDGENICDSVLNNFQKVFNDKKCDSNVYCSAIYINPKYKIISSNTIGYNDCKIGMLQYFLIEDENKSKINIINFHGATGRGDDKLDNDERIKQSKYAIDYLNDKDGIKIITGDLNILQGTKSINIFSENGYQDLIKNYSIKTTRNKLALDLYETKFLDSDYVFIDNYTNVKKFIVEDNLVSDHLPLLLEI